MVVTDVNWLFFAGSTLTLPAYYRRGTKINIIMIFDRIEIDHWDTSNIFNFLNR